jgi:hypothetical protein
MSITKIYRPMQLTKETDIYLDIQMFTNTLCGKNAGLLMLNQVMYISATTL